MRFWDSSAIIPLLITEASTPTTTAEFERDPELIVWWGTEVECVSALARLDREARVVGPEIVAAFDRLDELGRGWQEIQPVERVRQTANRLLRVHGLRAADALQLGAAIAASEDQPATLTLVTLDDRLARAAEREGFNVITPGISAA